MSFDGISWPLCFSKRNKPVAFRETRVVLHVLAMLNVAIAAQAPVAKFPAHAEHQKSAAVFSSEGPVFPQMHEDQDASYTEDYTDPPLHAKSSFTLIDAADDDTEYSDFGDEVKSDANQGRGTPAIEGVAAALAETSPQRSGLVKDRGTTLRHAARTAQHLEHASSASVTREKMIGHTFSSQIKKLFSVGSGDTEGVGSDSDEHVSNYDLDTANDHVIDSSGIDALSDSSSTFTSASGDNTDNSALSSEGHVDQAERIDGLHDDGRQSTSDDDPSTSVIEYVVADGNGASSAAGQSSQEESIDRDDADWTAMQMSMADEEKSTSEYNDDADWTAAHMMLPHGGKDISDNRVLSGETIHRKSEEGNDKSRTQKMALESESRDPEAHMSKLQLDGTRTKLSGELPATTEHTLHDDLNALLSEMRMLREQVRQQNKQHSLEVNDDKASAVDLDPHSSSADGFIFRFDREGRRVGIANGTVLREQMQQQNKQQTSEVNDVIASSVDTRVDPDPHSSSDDGFIFRFDRQGERVGIGNGEDLYSDSMVEGDVDDKEEAAFLQWLEDKHGGLDLMTDRPTTVRKSTLESHEAKPLAISMAAKMMKRHVAPSSHSSLAQLANGTSSNRQPPRVYDLPSSRANGDPPRLYNPSAILTPSNDRNVKQKEEPLPSCNFGENSWSYLFGSNLELVAVKRGPTTSTGMTEIHRLSSTSKYKSFDLQTTTALPLSQQSTWSFALDNKDNLFAFNIGYKRTELHRLTIASDYRERNLHKSLGLKLSPDHTWSLLLDSRNNVIAVKRGPRTQVIRLTAKTKYDNENLRTISNLNLTSDGVWSFVMDSADNIIAIKRGPTTPSGKTEVHRLTFKSGYKETNLDGWTGLNLTGSMSWSFTMDRADNLIAVKRGPSTLSGTTELYRLTKASRYREVDLQTGTGLEISLCTTDEHGPSMIGFIPKAVTRCRERLEQRKFHPADVAIFVNSKKEDGVSELLVSFYKKYITPSVQDSTEFAIMHILDEIGVNIAKVNPCKKKEEDVTVNDVDNRTAGKVGNDTYEGYTLDALVAEASRTMRFEDVKDKSADQLKELLRQRVSPGEVLHDAASVASSRIPSSGGASHASLLEVEYANFTPNAKHWPNKFVTSFGFSEEQGKAMNGSGTNSLMQLHVDSDAPYDTKGVCGIMFPAFMNIGSMKEMGPMKCLIDEFLRPVYKQKIHPTIKERLKFIRHALLDFWEDNVEKLLDKWVQTRALTLLVASADKFTPANIGPFVTGLGSLDQALEDGVAGVCDKSVREAGDAINKFRSLRLGGFDKPRNGNMVKKSDQADRARDQAIKLLARSVQDTVLKSTAQRIKHFMSRVWFSLEYTVLQPDLANIVERAMLALQNAGNYLIATCSLLPDIGPSMCAIIVSCLNGGMQRTLNALRYRYIRDTRKDFEAAVTKRTIRFVRSFLKDQMAGKLKLEPDSDEPREISFAYVFSQLRATLKQKLPIVAQRATKCDQLRFDMRDLLKDT